MFPLALLLIVLGLSGGTWRWWAPDLLVLIPAGRSLLAYIGITTAIAVVSAVQKKRLPTLRSFAEPRVWGAGLFVIFFSDWLCRPYAFFQGPSIRGELIIGFVAALLILRGPWQRALQLLPLVTAFLTLWSFAGASNGRLLFSDDHAMFLFRLKLLKENFPSIPFWSPTWNLGIDARDFFATGSLNAFLIFAPLIYAFQVEAVYNVIIALIAWCIVPLATYVASRMFGAKTHTAGLAAALAMCAGLTWYRWALQYGTIGFIVSTSLTPLVLALGYRFVGNVAGPRWITHQEFSPRDAAILVGVTSLLMLWLPACAALVPLSILALPFIGSIGRSKRHLLVIAALIVINTPWILMTMKVSKVTRFLSAEKPAIVAQQSPSPQGLPTSDALLPVASTAQSSAPSALTSDPGQMERKSQTFRHDASARTGVAALKKALKIWQETSCSLNPLFLIFGLPALLILPRTQRLLFGLTTLWLFALGTIGVHLKPQLELDRMLVMGSFLLSYPLANYLTQIFERAGQGLWLRLIAGLSGSFVFIGPFSLSSVVLNRSFTQYHFAHPSVETLAQTIKAQANDGRVLFSGCVLHQLSEGHLAPLAMWAHTPLVASSYAHNIWRYEQSIPKSYLERKDAGITDFLNDINATLVVAHEPEWRRYFLERPNQFREVAHIEKFLLFQRLDASPSYVREGAVENLRQDDHSVTFTPRSERVVLKFRFFPFLRSSQCRIAPFRVAPELELIELTQCATNRETTISSVSPMTRLLQGE